ncbi:hypothetical protein ACHMZP_21775 [Rhodococcus baikonurensis]|uniref:hypothetical protein n=1 Tax=Rhodococcus baikonurensis TaxID=172041 RepID=UPI00379080D8
MSNRNNRDYEDDGIEGEVVDGSWGKDLDRRDRRDRHREPERDDYENEEVDSEINEPQVVRRRPANRRERRSAGRIPQNAPRPQDRKAPQSSAAQAEAEGGSVTIKFWGMSFTTDQIDPLEWDEDVALAFERNQIGVFLAAIFGQQKYHRYITADPKPKRADTFELFNLVANALGGDAGE